ncbi:MAG TPA: T9SS type A sorting domain-containing protein [Flavisolibacter sp.]
MKKVFTLFLLAVTTFSIAAPPTKPSTNFGFYTIDGTFFNLGWTGGDGARRLMVVKAGSAPTFIPQNGIDYDANTEYGKGQMVAPGEYIVYDHTSFSFWLTGLQPATQYFFRMFEYNGSGTTTEYLTSAYLSASGWTSRTPTLQASNASFTNITTNSVTIQWTNGDGQRRLIVAREGAAVNADPVDNEPYSGASYQFGNGSTTGPGNYAVYRSSGNYTTVSNLKPGTTYHFAIYEFNGNQDPQYLRPGYATSVTTRNMPTVPSSNITFTRVDGKELSLSWTEGNGQRRVVIAKKGSDVTSVPTDGIDYTSSETFGQGQQLAPGEFVVYDNNHYTTTVTGLDPASTYYFKIFEYDGTGTSTIYLTSAFASTNGSTAVKPTVQTQLLPTSNITANAIRLNFTPGNGRARLVVGRKGSPVNFTPTDLTAYDYDNYFGASPDLGNGNFALAYTNQNAVTIQSLQPNSTYHFAIFELNGFNQPLYLTPPVTTSASTTGTLPVKLKSWEASIAGSMVLLKWKTATELNASHFVVERSTDGLNFQPLTQVDARGNSTAEVSYTAEDKSPLPGANYYRLKMVDLDATSEYSATKLVNVQADVMVRILQNPVQDRLQVVSAIAKKAEWHIINISGQVLAKGVLSGGQVDIPVSHFTPGRYWLRVEQNAATQTIPFVKQ